MTAMLAESNSGVNLDRVSLCALSSSTRELLSNCLNTKKLIPSENNYLRDWRGLAQLAKVSVSADSANPTENVIHMWQISSVDDPRPTVGNLLLFLGQIDRWDVVDDLKEQILNDAKEFSDGMNRPLMPSQIDEREIITLDDVERYRQGLPLEKYDAFFLYVDEDAGFANDIVTLLESELNLKLCLKDRDLVGGIRFEHDAIMRLIANRCSHLIVVISKDFINSEAHKFFFKYAEALSIEQGRRKIVPCVYNARIIDVPPEFKFYFLLDRSRSNSLRDYCARLKASIAPRYAPALPAPALPAPALPAPAISQEDIQVRCTIEEISSQVSLRELATSSRGATQVVQMPDPSAFASPVKSQLDFSVEPSSSSVSKPVSPALRIKKIFNRSKGSSVDSTSNATGTGTATAQPKTKKKNNWFSSKKKIAVAES